MVIWKDVPVKVNSKIHHIEKIGGRLMNSFVIAYGDVPVCRYNVVSGSWEEVVNNRGFAYAARNRLAYRKNKHK